MTDAFSSDEDEGVRLPGKDEGFKINSEFAARFEHNKKREELQRLEEKFASGSNKRKLGDDEDEDDSGSSSDETEDDDAELATADLDAEIAGTLEAIRRKDPRVYDPTIKFYKEFDAAAGEVAPKTEKEKPMYLQDYHRQNLLAGHIGEDEDDNDQAPIRTYQQEQDAMRRELVGSMHASAKDDAAKAPGNDDEDDFLVAKAKPTHLTLGERAEARSEAQKTKAKKITETDIASADKDPETYLSNFMAARAWLPNGAKAPSGGTNSRFQAFDSDDSEDDQRADAFEEAYNLRFENPGLSNERLMAFSRDVGKYGVRRDDLKGRKKAREREREKKDAIKREREEDRARLRKLKIEEAEEKVRKIKEAAGIAGEDVDLDEWKDVLEGDFEGDEWEKEMGRRFGEGYYGDVEGSKKPKWNDDIDIKDLIPEFAAEEEGPEIVLTSDDDEDAEGGAPLPVTQEDGEDDAPSDDDDTTLSSEKMSKTKKDRQQEKADAKRSARKQRAKIEAIVDASLPLSHPSLPVSSAPAAGFRYRATSPTSFGLSARDILFADDTALNTYVGLKKMASFRDPEKKRKDKKKFSKKQRLREWRRETFGSIEEPGVVASAAVSAVNMEKMDEAADKVLGGEKKRKKRAGKKRKLEGSEEI